MISNVRSTSILIALIASVSVAAETTENPALSATDREPATMVRARAVDRPMVFTKNVGQWPDSILFRADAGMTTMWFTKNGPYYQFSRDASADASARHSLREGRSRKALETSMIRAVFPGAQASPRVYGEGEYKGRYNYFIGDDPAGWRTNVPVYRAVVFEGLYPGIDLKYYGHGGQMEYDFIVEPGSDPAQIRVRYEGAQALAVNARGDLVVETEWATVIERVPTAYQVAGDELLSVTAVYELIDQQTFGFSVLDAVQSNLALVIDPVLSYSSYLGGSGDDRAHGVAVDDFGNTYVAGQTSSANFPTQGPYQGDQGGIDAFVIKLSADGQTLVYGTYLGGSAPDIVNDLAVDDKGDAYVVGTTESTNFPMVNAYQGDQQFPDGFVAKLNGLGDSLIYSTYLGGSSFDEGHAVAVDANGYAYVTGSTSSSNFPTKNPYQTNQAGEDAFVVKLGQMGDSLVYGTYLGGNHIDFAYALDLDTDENVYVTGQTLSSDFPTVNPYQGDQGDADTYVAKLSASGDSLIYGTYLGGAAADGGHGIAVDGSGQAYVTGYTSSTDFPTSSPYQTDMPLDDAFLVKLNSTGSGLVYATYLGGDRADYGRDVAVDPGGHAYVVGWTLSLNFPTVNPDQTSRDTVDGFAVIFDAAGSALDYGTYLAGSDVDDARAVAVASNGDAYVVGRTDSPNFLMQDPYQTNQVGRDAFMLMLEAVPVAVSDDNATRPEDHGLVSNYPNPFNRGTVVRFTLARSEAVELTVYNLLGEKVATLCDRVLTAGLQEIRWDGRDNSGRDLPSGSYLYRLRTGELLREGKMTLLK
jgi:hypothetical protein